MIELFDFRMQHLLLDVILNMTFVLLLIQKLIILGILNKGIDFINLPSIFKDTSVISSIPTYFENKESPIICYKCKKKQCNKPICITSYIF